ncbi:hypothetical protein MPTP_1167 [Melissococcus plutonius ATCC 35311]|uniref:Uncharacterized protein n=1 Tax=Melissococcus plutonius (strain ATCC 35311 / DSM 29964 / CIP 104052 / LMG 20360 / NCIMB 702443) TaxID=940190 RepID=F3YAU0_MELPT|nr:hypothetical protein MPTP_1167 [Melissococcus plutonius ATCC 35311]BBD15394.1 hypothetical protein DAT585_1066 [Melissococcus plutonius]BBD16906.1 hypothetical protein DAT606_0891 [Melissococcus plutonius]BBP07462.1 hypothetical protein DAT1033_0891 [Melissococcus plutonius]
MNHTVDICLKKLNLKQSMIYSKAIIIHSGINKCLFLKTM